jgi:signal transduction histidine kinase
MRNIRAVFVLLSLALIAQLGRESLYLYFKDINQPKKIKLEIFQYQKNNQVIKEINTLENSTLAYILTGNDEWQIEHKEAKDNIINAYDSLYESMPKQYQKEIAFLRDSIKSMIAHTDVLMELRDNTTKYIALDAYQKKEIDVVTYNIKLVLEQFQKSPKTSPKTDEKQNKNAQFYLDLVILFLNLTSFTAIVVVAYLIYKNHSKSIYDQETVNELNQTHLKLVEKMNEHRKELLRKNDKLQKLEEDLRLKLDIISANTQKLENTNKQLEQSIRNELKKQEELQEVIEANEHLIAIVAHDLRSPINNIGGIIEIIKSEFRKANLPRNPWLVEYLTVIERAYQKSIQIVNDILEASVLENEDISLTTYPVFFNSFIQKCIQDNQQLIVKKQIEVTFEQDARIQSASINLIKFERIIDNLISNAVKFSHEGKAILITTELKNEDTILLTIKDEGIGMSQQMLGKLFDKFSKAGRFGTQGEKSTGLGMYIVKQIVEKHNGKIYVESQEDVGTTFYIEIPQTPDVKQI